MVTLIGEATIQKRPLLVWIRYMKPIFSFKGPRLFPGPICSVCAYMPSLGPKYLKKGPRAQSRAKMLSTGFNPAPKFSF